ncbi:hypothetical protein PIB19_22430 [Sphingomonas sp. 7/4-4]|uniref:hypothetical protein n=1 Tax=Sphingomonas sp. 7/4-4 TaxID=3018446 RepID=UPI0022F3A9F3|nr:hypothetical protein [Sphingomonas sp. 7/4-4]WBY07963.1 hypothetical protein PIB19_22430 [Sphingomonas sp. 7/4-4]
MDRAPASGRVGVVQIAFRPYGVEAFEAFFASYRRHSAGLDHDLIIALKGFETPAQAEPFLDLLSGVDFTPIWVPDRGYDIGTYFHVARAHSRPVYCFLNSKSVIVADGWLAALHAHAIRDEIGLAGATASLESLYSDHLTALQGEMAGPRWRVAIRRSWLNSLRHRLRYPPFPNPHLRTNAFMVREDVWRRVRRGRMISRRDASQFENGWRSITRQVTAMGLDVVVVGRDGRAYKQPEWPMSNTFWQGEQENLLVADNQTEKYAVADFPGRAALNALAWNHPPN